MSAQVGGSTPPQAQPNGRTKKNSIGSWFSKRFGRRASEAANNAHEVPYANHATGNETVPARKAAVKASDDRAKTATLSNINGGAQGAANGGHQPQLASAFASNQAHGLANTLTVPNNDVPGNGRLTPPPQLDGIPSQEPLGAIDLPRSPRSDTGSGQDPGTHSPSTVTYEKPLELETRAYPGGSSATDGAGTSGAADPISGAIISSAPQATGGPEADTDDESSFADRDSIGNRTMDTSKSRASTKPTTLMSLETRETTVLPTTHIAQPRQSRGEDSFGNSNRLSTGPREGSAIHFAPDSVSRSGSGQINSGSNSAEGGSNFINVPSHSRPHPNNNPHPSAIPADNASMLTLASSTAGMSLGGVSRSQHHAPSLGGARSVGGSLMGDRRNSSDTYASLKALPPLSRRGSDSSSRTRDSVAASSTGQNSHQAMYPAGVLAGPGAPSDRVSLHRTPSQKTVATQMSIPLSASASNPALQAYAKSEHTANGSQPHLSALQTGHVTAEPELGAGEHGDEDTMDRPLERSAADLGDSQVTAHPAAAPSEELLEAQASNLAATEHDKMLQAAAAGQVREKTEISDPNGGVKEEEPFDVPGGPPVA
ncbi:hypothetical protein NDA11_005414 [Ustilago hordei]|uniref:Uncharacterized protein n=1 Tax=Ustilago hordei TaxID=120017 RepID=I2G4P6_USTHO|nr:uncharacterized protein UHO2_01285 [Ustilago hordei]KAJ1044585.1 hypothetical protein NDA10_002844 [Ustilago hordei]KAJ1583050.1 hypothetical protein NDA15_000033 [Ustilago hordei]KAJ1586765.1 hypothetical protein NDA11_005414 [Ustilago hordei]KAJ1591670.1 hypothetical protein NDA12_002010 [Ustilago hordei]UTT94795.1 hypothetical protein NDA17_007581 [Ustilago hordei]